MGNKNSSKSGAGAGNTPAPETQKTAPELLGSPALPAEFTIGDQTHTVGQMIVVAFTKAGITAEEWNALTDDERQTKVAAAVDAAVSEAVSLTAPGDGANKATDAVDQSQAGQNPPGIGDDTREDFEAEDDEPETSFLVLTSEAVKRARANGDFAAEAAIDHLHQDLHKLRSSLREALTHDVGDETLSVGLTMLLEAI